MLVSLPSYRFAIRRPEPTMPRFFANATRRKRSVRNLAFAIHQDPGGTLSYDVPVPFPYSIPQLSFLKHPQLHPLLSHNAHSREGVLKVRLHCLSFAICASVDHCPWIFPGLFITRFGCVRLLSWQDKSLVPASSTERNQAHSLITIIACCPS